MYYDTLLLGLFASSLAAERASGGTGQDTLHCRTLFLQSLTACLARGTTDIVVALSCFSHDDE